MQIFHISAECYPAAKVGGLADVAGSLPKYLNLAGEDCDVSCRDFALAAEKLALLAHLRGQNALAPKLRTQRSFAGGDLLPFDLLARPVGALPIEGGFLGNSSLSHNSFPSRSSRDVLGANPR